MSCNPDAQVPDRTAKHWLPVDNMDRTHCHMTRMR